MDSVEAHVRRRTSHRKKTREDPLSYVIGKEAAEGVKDSETEKDTSAADAGGQSGAVEQAALRAERASGRKRKRIASAVPAGTIMHELVSLQAREPGDLPRAGPVHAADQASSAAADAEAWGMHPHLKARIAAEGFRQFFSVQRAVVPLLLCADATCDPTVGDVCVAAPTGSGKTLVYVLPILHALLSSRRTVRLLRALVLVPTRELATQVLEVFNRFTAGTDIVIFAATGQSSLAAERAVLGGASSTASVYAEFLPACSRPGCDILVATPGRLVEHLESTPDFTLRHLRFWVIDEADRLLSEAYQDWPRRVRESVFAPAPRASAESRSIVPTTLRRSVDSVAGVPDSPHWPEAPASIGTGLLTSVLRPYPAQRRLRDASEPELAHAPIPLPFRVIVCSATLTTNPRKLASLQLRVPMHFEAAADASDSAVTRVLAPTRDVLLQPGLSQRRVYQLPPTLLQAWAVCGAGEKPLLLLYLLRLLEQTQRSAGPARVGGPAAGGLLALVFAGSVETTHRLARMLQLFGGLEGRVVEFSTTLSQSQRTAVLEAARLGAVSVLVSSDVAARGLDLPMLPVVFQYDAASRAKTYVHRVGRVARAGHPGATISILKPEQVRHFQMRIMARMVGGAGPVVKETVPGAAVHPYTARFGRVLEALRDVLERERTGQLLPTRLLGAVQPEEDLPLPPRAALATLGEEVQVAVSTVASVAESDHASTTDDSDTDESASSSSSESSSVSDLD